MSNEPIVLHRTTLMLVVNAVEPAYEQTKIQCTSDHRTLALASKEGISLWCRQCRTSRLLTWTALHRLEQDLQTGEEDAMVELHKQEAS